MKNLYIKSLKWNVFLLFVCFSTFFTKADVLKYASNQTATIDLIDATGNVKLTYISTESMFIRITDADRNANALSAETITVLVTSITEPLGESVVLTETGINTGIFKGSLAFNVSTTPSASNGKLDVQKGEKVVVKYNDPADDFGNPVVVTAKVYFNVTVLSGTIVESLTKAKSPYLLTGDIIIPQGYIINVEAGTEIRFTALKDDKAAGTDVNRIEIIVNGKFNVNGTASDSVRFMSNADNPAIGDWYGIRYESFTTSNIKYAVLQHATQVLSYNTVNLNSDTIRVQNCRIVNDGSGILVNSVSYATFDVSYNNYNCSGRFFYGTNPTQCDLVFKSNTIKTNSDVINVQYIKKISAKQNQVLCSGYGYFLSSNYANGNIELLNNYYEGINSGTSMMGNFFYDYGGNNTNRTVSVKGNTIRKGSQFLNLSYYNNSNLQLAEIENNDVFSQSGISMSQVSKASVKNNRFYLTSQADSTTTANSNNNNGSGCSLSTVSNASITDNIFTARGFDGTGISLNQSNALVKNNKVSGFDKGIYATSTFENPTTDSIQYNTITYNYTRGVQLDGYTRMPFNYNNIYNNYDTISYNQNSAQYFNTQEFYCNTGNLDQVDARFNYWGKTVTTQMATGVNPKNITRIYDKQDNPLMSFVNYAQWLDRPFGMKGIKIIATQNDICEGKTITLSLVSVAADDQKYAITVNDGGSTVVWSTGETTPTKVITPTQTTKYSVNYTNESGTYKDSVTILVTSISPPTGDTLQYVTDGSKLKTVRVFGTNIKWYDAKVGGNVVDSTTTIVNGTTYYATQTLATCESVKRLAIKVLIGDPFTLPYTGTGNNNMTFYVQDAKIKGVLLQPEDVISIFDGNICVGKYRLNSVLPIVSPFVSVSTSMAESGLSNGFTEGHNIRVKIWDASASKVYNALADFYLSNVKINPQTFTANGQAYVKISTVELSDITLDNNTVKEIQPINTFITKIRPVQYDQYDSYKFALVNGTTANDNNLFVIKGDSLLTNAAYDYEQIDSLKINIKATNSFVESITKEKVIKISNVNESPFGVYLTKNNVDENTPENKLVARIKAYDYDKNDSHTFALVVGDGDVQNSYFKVKGDSLLTNKKILFSIGSIYSIRLKATDIGGLSIAKKILININDSSIIDLPQIPANLNANLYGYTKVNLVWDKNPELKLSGYNVYRAEKDSSLKFVKVLNATTNFKDSLGLQYNTWYMYVVTAVDSVGKESHKSYVSLKTGDILMPDTVRNLLGQGIANAIQLNWTKNKENDIWKYQIYRGTAPDVMSLYAEVDNKLSTYLDANLTPEVWYFYKVTAVDSVGVSIAWDKSYEGVASNLVYAKAKDQLAPNAPTLVTAELYDFRKVKISWKANTEKDLKNYRVYRSVGSGTQSLLNETFATNLKDSFNLNYQTHYNYYVTALDTLGNESQQTTISILTGDALAPDSVRNLFATGSVDVIQLGWTASSNADFWKYRLYKGTSENNMTLLKEISKGTNYYYDFVVMLGTKYYYSISAVDSLGLNPTWDPANEGPRSKSISIFAKDIVGPVAPTITSSSSSNKKVSFSWNKLTELDLNKYRIYRGLTSDNLTVLDSLPKSATSYKDISVANSKTYYYTVCGVDTNRNEGIHSKLIIGQPYNIPPIIAQFDDITLHDVTTSSKNMQLNIGESLDIDGLIDNAYWYKNGVLVTNNQNPLVSFEQGTSQVKVVIVDNDGGKDSTSFFVNIDSKYRSFTDATTGNAGISTIGNDYIFLPLKAGKMQILHNDFTNKFDVAVGGEIGSVSSISTDTVMYLASTDKSVYSFDRNGISKWNYPIGGIMQATPTIDTKRNLIYVGVSNNNIFAIDRITGKVKWYYRTTSPINQPCVILGSDLLLTLTDAGVAYIFNLDGQVLSDQLTPLYSFNLGSSLKSAPAIDVNKNLFITTLDGRLLRYIIRSGSNIKTGEVSTNGSFEVSPVIGYDGTVYVGSKDSSLYAFDGTSNSLDLKWTKKFDAPISTTATINEFGIVYIGTENGKMYAISETGDQLWFYNADSKIGNATAYVDGNIIFTSQKGGLYKIYDGWRYQSPSLAPGLIQRVRSVSKLPQWGTYQGNYRRSGAQTESNQVVTAFDNTFNVQNELNINNYPNPFDISTRISFEVTDQGKVEIRITDVFGKVVEIFNLGIMNAGIHQQTIIGGKYPAGVYFYQVIVGEKSALKSMMKK